MSYEIRFPHPGIVLRHVPLDFYIFGFRIALYGVVITIAMAAGTAIAMRTAKKTG